MNMPTRRTRADLPAIWFERRERRHREKAGDSPLNCVRLQKKAEEAGVPLSDRSAISALGGMEMWLGDELDPDGSTARRLETRPAPRFAVLGAVLAPMHHLAAWRAYGRRVYVLDALTCELLAHTALPRLPFGEVPVPLPAFYVVLPAGQFRFAPLAPRREQPLEGASLLVHDRAGPTGSVREIRVLFCSADPERAYYNETSELAIVADAAARLDEVLDARGTAARRLGDREFGERIERILFGLLLYLASEHPLLEAVAPARLPDPARLRNAAKRRKAEQAIRRASRLSYFYVGGEAPEPAASRDSADTGRRLDHQVWVTGHWKQQPYGPDGSLRRPQWIRPYLRGPDVAESTRLRVGIVRPAQLRTRE